MDQKATTLPDTSERLRRENERLRAALKRQQELYEKSHLELIELMVESEKQAQELKALNQKVQQAFLNTIAVIQQIIDMRQPGYRLHSDRVAEMARQMAEELRCSKQEIQTIFVAARIHEVGKMSIPEKVLQKPREQLEPNEIRLLHSQHAIGAMLLEKVAGFRKIARIIRHIRENVDGSGRPEGLSGEQIPLGSRILALADCFDTRYMVRQVSSDPEALLAEIEAQLDMAFDRRIFPALEKVVREKYADAYRPKEKVMAIGELAPGMRLSRDLYTASGLLLLRRGTDLNEQMIKKIFRYQTVDPVPGGVYIQTQ